MHRNNAERKSQLYSDTHNIIYYNKPSLGEYKPIRFSSKRFRKKVLVRHGDIMFEYKHIDIYYSLI